MKTPTPLTAGLIGKGAAVPTPAALGATFNMAPPLTNANGDGTSQRAEVQQAKSVNTYHKALTLKLDEARYRALKLVGLELDLSSQDILVEALDAWLRTRAE